MVGQAAVEPVGPASPSRGCVLAVGSDAAARSCPTDRTAADPVAVMGILASSPAAVVLEVAWLGLSPGGSVPATRPDMRLIGATVQRATAFVAREFHAIPSRSRLRIDRIDLAAIRPRAPFPHAEGLVVEVAVDDVVIRRGRVTGLRSRVEIHRGGVTVGDGFAHVTVLPPRIRLRHRDGGHRIVDGMIIEAVRRELESMTPGRPVELVAYDARRVGDAEPDVEALLNVTELTRDARAVVARFELTQGGRLVATIDAAAEGCGDTAPTDLPS